MRKYYLPLLLFVIYLFGSTYASAATPGNGQIINEQTGVVFNNVIDAIADVSDGQTLLFGPGSFVGEVIDDGNPNSSYEKRRPVKLMGKNSITLKGINRISPAPAFDNKQTTLEGLYIEECENVTIENVEITQNHVPWPSEGVMLVNSMGIELTQSKISAAKASLVILDTDDVTIARTIFTNAPYRFIHAEGANDSLRFINNTFATITMETPIWITSDDPIEFKNNLLYMLYSQMAVDAYMPVGSDLVAGNVFVALGNPGSDVAPPLYDYVGGQWWSFEQIEVNNVLDGNIVIEDVIDYEYLSDLGSYALVGEDNLALDEGVIVNGVNNVFDGAPDSGAIERQEWNTRRSYELNQIVYWEGAYYVCIMAHTAWDPNWNPANTPGILWSLLEM